ncbi:hypothetical protein ACHWQZ_G006681 [Mnemiopsis leidyi]
MSNKDDRLNNELNFLVLKFLRQPGLENAHEAFLRCLMLSNDNNLCLPSSSSFEAPSKQRNIVRLEREYEHITPKHLLEVLRAAKNVVTSGPAPGLQTILGHSSYTLSALLERSVNSEGNPEVAKPRISKNLVVNISNRQYGRGHLRAAVAEKSAKSPILVTRILGHLAPIYCIVIDRTGTVAFTGADDGLVKMWSLERYFLLATLRGHKKEISDLSVNSRNTMLASGSCDKEIRIWCLQSTKTLAVLTGHRASVNSIHFSPNDDYLTTSASDGLVCFWPITGPKSISDDPITFYERVRSADKLLSSSFSTGGTVLAVGSSDGDIFTYSVRGELGLPVKDQTLEGHSAMVITLTFAKRSLRFVSGSKDGTVRIWTRNSGVWDQVVCSARTRVVTDRDPKEQIDVLFSQWSNNENRVLASCSDTSIRMWNMAGELVQVFLGHDDEAYFVQEHPLVSDVLVTCGHDGHIITWCVESGEALTTFLNVIEGEGRASVLEASFTSSGEHLLTVDANGHISIFGHEMLKGYVNVPREQFFNTDYHSLIRDRFSNVLDEQTEMPPHSVGPPYMVDQQGLALSAPVQGLIPGRHFLTPADIVLLKKKKKNKRALDFVRRVITPRGRILSGDRVPTTTADLPELADFQRSFVVPANEEDLDFDHIPSVVPPMSNYDLFDGVMSQSIAMLNPRKSRDLWLNRTLVPVLSDLQIDKPGQELVRAEELVKFRETEVQLVCDRTRKSSRNARNSGKAPVRQTRQSKPAVQFVSSSEEEEEEEGDTEEDEHSSDVDWQVSEMRQKRKPIVIRDDDGGEEGDDSQTDSQDNTPCYITSSEGEGRPPDKEDTPQPSTRKRLRVRKPRRESSGETVLDQSVLDTIRRPKKNTRSLERAIKKLKRMIGVKTPKRNCIRQRSTSVNQDEATSPTKETPGPDKEDSEMEEEATLAVMEEYRTPKWLTQIQPARSPYLPQISDKIYYFVQGHMDYVNSEHCPPEAHKTQPWEQMRERSFRHAEPCQVLSLAFLTGPPTLCQVKLGILNKDDEIEDTFLFRYHDADFMPDFMVLKRHYEDSMNHRWLKGDKFRSLIDAEWWEGIVVSKSAVDEEFYPESPWKRIMVKWDNEPDKERLSAWDIEPLPKDTRSAKRRSPTKKHSSQSRGEDGSSSSRQHFSFGTSSTNTGPLDPYILSYYHSYGNWGEEGREAFKERFSAALLQAMELKEAREILYPVSFTDHPDYYMIVGYPVELTTIHNRLTENHYRSIDSVLWEIRQLEINARVYNEDDSPIVRDVTSIVTRLTLFIKTPEFKDINVDVTREMISAELEYRSKSKKKKRRLRVRSANKTEWFERASEILESLSNHPDSQPFMTPVDITIYNDYLKYCQEPMDLETITDKLHSGCYTLEVEFYNDIDLIFKNSFIYNTRSSSTIYKMTKRLQNHYHSLIDRLAESGNDLTSHVTPPSRPRTAVPLELVVPRSKHRVSSGNSDDATTASYRSSKGKERASTRKKIYSTSSSGENDSSSSHPGTSSDRSAPSPAPPPDRPVSRSSVRSAAGESSEGGDTVSSGAEDGAASSTADTSSQLSSQRPRRKQSHVNYELYDRSSSSSEDERARSSSPSSDSSSWKENKRGNSNRAGVSRTTRRATNGTHNNNSSQHRLRNGKRKEIARDTDSESSETGESDSDHKKSSSGSDSDQRRTRSKRRRKESETVITTKRGRSVKKNVRYDDFY